MLRARTGAALAPEPRHGRTSRLAAQGRNVGQVFANVAYFGYAAAIGWIMAMAAAGGARITTVANESHNSRVRFAHVAPAAPTTTNVATPCPGRALGPNVANRKRRSSRADSGCAGRRG